MNRRVFIAGVGIISALGRGRRAHAEALARAAGGVKPLSLFPASHPQPLPVGEIRALEQAGTVPRTHQLALIAAREALDHADGPPDAIVLGVAGGGMSTTEVLLKEKIGDPSRYRDHAAGSVAAHIARAVGCRGPVLTVSTACSSGSVALAMAMEMIRSGRADSVLAGGADALCRLTYYGFHALQLVDPVGARPLDRNRRGMTVGEGAAMLLLTAADTPGGDALCELLGAGLSCDAYHPAAPQPQGLGALSAMRQALDDAGVKPSEIDYIHLHGTGTIDNDLAEARAVNALFGREMPLLSSTKGATGHTLGAAGAMGAVIAAIGVHEGLVPASRGYQNPDPELNLAPVMAPLQTEVRRVLVNAFGFGGNNASLVIGHPVQCRRINPVRETRPFSVRGMAVLTGAGDGPATMARLFAGDSVKGVLNYEALATHLPQRTVRRLKRLPRMVLTLAAAAVAAGGPPHAIFLGTGWGPLSEAYDFLTKLYESGEQFSSPTDFIGSVHNAPAGQAAMPVQATGPNITLSGGDYSFEQALLTASLFQHVSARPILLVGADEHHPAFAPLIEPAAVRDGPPADGGAAFLLKPGETEGMSISSLFFAHARQHPQVIPDAIAHLGGAERIMDRYAAIFFGIPAAYEASGRLQLREFLDAVRFGGAVVDYRRWTGEFASASAVATFLAAQCIQHDEIPQQMCGREGYSPDGRGILLLNLGEFVTALETVP
jgi:3-oxoacyl-[acyl-carrier-protein] synthase-1/3-oxoacyl-[acyl-carrier-protein] synthase II